MERLNPICKGDQLLVLLCLGLTHRESNLKSVYEHRLGITIIITLDFKGIFAKVLIHPCPKPDKGMLLEICRILSRRIEYKLISSDLEKQKKSC